MLDNLNNVIERQALLTNLKLTVSRSGESSVFTSVFTSSVYSCETSQREDRRVGLMTIASSVVAE